MTNIVLLESVRSSKSVTPAAAMVAVISAGDARITRLSWSKAPERSVGSVFMEATAVKPSGVMANNPVPLNGAIGESASGIAEGENLYSPCCVTVVLFPIENN